ncbi:MAG TPA: lytic transglycosylase domain-containing protein [Anaeromyxobacteraceae bacterium]|nr:lytic transglycosylase domain-containing protein [Anaeromyxobacteraceae bacterium]
MGLAVLAGANVCYQTARKPTELLGLVAPRAAKSPAQTWKAYGGLCQEHSTPTVGPELLAALVQVESAGDPLARTPWRFRWSANPFKVYTPASSAVGLLQMTDGTYEQARRLCIRDHAVARDGAWYDPSTCFLNALYFRTVPSHAIEMTAAWLHVTSEQILARPGVRAPSREQRRALAALVHLCGPERGAAFAARGFRTLRGERCGDQDLRAYLERVRILVAAFEVAGAAGQ